MTAAAPPHPRANLVLGSALDLRRSQIRTYERVMRAYGDVVRLAVGPPITLRPEGAVPIQPAAR